MSDFAALIITVIVIFFTLGLFSFQWYWGWVVPVAWLAFYAYDQHQLNSYTPMRQATRNKPSRYEYGG
jgi:hypothetical protein